MSAEATNESNEKKATRNGTTKGRKPRVISRPADVAGLVMMQLDAVNAKKDELTMAIKALADTTKQLVRAYAEHTQAIAELQERVKQLEGKTE